MVAVGDPIGTGLVPSLARPGGNLTGLSSVAPDLEGKRLQLLREVTPALSHVAMFINSLNPFHISSMEQARAAAQAMGIKLRLHDIRKSEDLDDAFAAIRKERPDALLILADRVFLHNRERIVDFANEQRLPNVNAYKELVEVGGLMSYGPSYEDMHKRAAIYVDKILKGAKPADLPIEQPSKFTFIVNLRAAKTLGVTVPSQLLDSSTSDRMRPRDVRFWHKRTLASAMHMSAIGDKADINFCAAMPAVDPKRTSGADFLATSIPHLRWRSSQQFVQHKPKSICLGE